MPISAGRNLCSLSQSVNAYKLHPPKLHLSGCRYNFRAREQEVAALEGLQQKALAAWYRSTIAPGGKQRRKLCVQVTAFLFPTDVCTAAVVRRGSVLWAQLNA